MLFSPGNKHRARKRASEVALGSVESYLRLEPRDSLPRHTSCFLAASDGSSRFDGRCLYSKQHRQLQDDRLAACRSWMEEIATTSMPGRFGEKYAVARDGGCVSRRFSPRTTRQASREPMPVKSTVDSVVRALADVDSDMKFPRTRRAHNAREYFPQDAAGFRQDAHASTALCSSARFYGARFYPTALQDP